MSVKMAAETCGVVRDTKEMQQVVPLITRETAFCQNVCELVFGFDILDLDFWVQVDSVKLPVQSNPVGSWHVSHRWIPAFDYHLDYGFIVLKDIQHSIGTRMCSA